MYDNNREHYNSYFEPPHREWSRTPGCNPPYPYFDVNRVKDYRMLENHEDPGQVSLRQNINGRHVRVENSTNSAVLVGISICRDPHQQPKPKFHLRSGEVRDLSINMPGERLQFLWLFDPKTGHVLNDPHAMHNHMNLFSLIEGLNRWWIMDFQHKGYRGQF